MASERRGLLTVEGKKGTKVVHVQKESAAYLAGLSRADIIVSINNYAIKGDVDSWLHYFEGEDVELRVIRNNKEKVVSLPKSNSSQFWEYLVK